MSTIDTSIFDRQQYAVHCQTARASDYYGLGVRLGIYFTWVQTYIANNFLPDEISGAADTNTIFLLVLLIAMIRDSSFGKLEQVDGLILMHLSGGFIFGTFSIWGYRTRQYFDKGPKAIRNFGGWGTHARLIISLAVSSYGLWFWRTGITGSLVRMGSPEEVGELAVDPPNSPDCATLHTFLLAKFRADGGIRIYYMIVCTCCILYFGIMVLFSTIAGWARINKMIKLGKQKRWADNVKLRFTSGFTYRESELLFKCLRVLNLIWTIYSAVLVEVTLNFNNITGVLGGRNGGGTTLHLPGQLLPLLIGTFGMSASVTTPTRARTLRARNVLLAFSPAMDRDARSKRYDPNEDGELERNMRWPVRYLVAWLPWLTLLPYFQHRASDETKHQSRSLSYQSGYSHPNEEIELEQPPKRITRIELRDVKNAEHEGAATTLL